MACKLKSKDSWAKPIVIEKFIKNFAKIATPFNRNLNNTDKNVPLTLRKRSRNSIQS